MMVGSKSPVRVRWLLIAVAGPHCALFAGYAAWNVF